MNELGTDLILVCSSCHPASLGGIDRAADDFAELGELAKAHGVRVGYEALAWGRHIDDHRMPGNRPSRQSRQHRSDCRQLPFSGAQARPELNPLNPG